MENIIEEVFIEKYASLIPIKGIEKIIFQIKNCVCRIIKEEGEKGTGFFCKIKANKRRNILPVLVTNNHILILKI